MPGFLARSACATAPGRWRKGFKQRHWLGVARRWFYLGDVLPCPATRSSWGPIRPGFRTRRPGENSPSAGTSEVAGGGSPHDHATAGHDTHMPESAGPCTGLCAVSGPSGCRGWPSIEGGRPLLSRPAGAAARFGTPGGRAERTALRSVDPPRTATTHPPPRASRHVRTRSAPLGVTPRGCYRLRGRGRHQGLIAEPRRALCLTQPAPQTGLGSYCRAQGIAARKPSGKEVVGAAVRRLLPGLHQLGHAPAPARRAAWGCGCKLEPSKAFVGPCGEDDDHITPAAGSAGRGRGEGTSPDRMLAHHGSTVSLAGAVGLVGHNSGVLRLIGDRRGLSLMPPYTRDSAQAGISYAGL